MAKRDWPRRPIGKRIKIGRFDSKDPWLTVVGVTETCTITAWTASPARFLSRPYTQGRLARHGPWW